MDRRCSVRIRGRRRCPPVQCHAEEVSQLVEVVADLDVLSRLHDVDAMDVVLERDQRTVKAVDTRTLRWSRVDASDSPCSRPSHQSSLVVCDQCCVRTPPLRIRSKKRSSSRSSAWFPAGSAIRWLVAVVCVLAVLPPRVMAAPAPKSSLASLQDQDPKWINPCGLKEVDQDLEDLSGPAVTVGELMQHIVVQAKNALMHTELFREDYVKRTFNVGFQQHHESWKGASYDWLPRIPKELQVSVEDDVLQREKLEDALKDTYRNLQKYAVGLEQMVWDEEADQGHFTETFKAMEYKLRSVLCEVQDVMMQQGVMPHRDVTRDIMPSDIRELKNNATYRHLRDWIIFRDYMNDLEYVIQLFEHFQGQNSQAS